MEELNPELKRELAIAVVCDLMDKYKGKPKPLDWFGKPLDSIEYDPSLVYEFAFSGKDSFYAFFDVLKSVKSVGLSNKKFSACLDKNVCMTQMDPVCHGDLNTAESFVIKNFFKYTRRLRLNYGKLSVSDGEFVMSYLGQMQHLKELVVDRFECLIDKPAEWSVFSNTLKSVTFIEAPLDVFEAFNQFGGKYKLEKMVIRDFRKDCSLDRVFNLSNFMPVELCLECRYPENVICQFLKKDFNTGMLANISKLSLKSLYLSGDEAPNIKPGEAVTLTKELVGLIPEKFPVLQQLDLCYCNDFHMMVYSVPDFEECMDRFRKATNLLEEFLKGRRQDKLKLNVFLTILFDCSCFGDVDTRFMKAKFPDYSLFVAEYNSTWKKWSLPAQNSGLGVAIQVL